MMFMQSLWLDNTVIPIYNILITKLVNQDLQMYNSRYLLMQIKTMTLEAFRRQLVQKVFTYHFRMYSYIFRTNCKKLMSFYNKLLLLPLQLMNFEKNNISMKLSERIKSKD